MHIVHAGVQSTASVRCTSICLYIHYDSLRSAEYGASLLLLPACSGPDKTNLFFSRLLRSNSAGMARARGRMAAKPGGEGAHFLSPFAPRPATTARSDVTRRSSWPPALLCVSGACSNLQPSTPRRQPKSAALQAEPPPVAAACCCCGTAMEPSLRSIAAPPIRRRSGAHVASLYGVRRTKYGCPYVH